MRFIGLFVRVAPLRLGGGKEVQQIFGELEDFGAAELGLAVDAVDKCDRHFADAVAQLTGPHQHFHLEYVALGDASRYERF